MLEQIDPLILFYRNSAKFKTVDSQEAAVGDVVQRNIKRWNKKLYKKNTNGNNELAQYLQPVRNDENRAYVENECIETPINHLKSQIACVEPKLENYCHSEMYTDASRQIEILENQWEFTRQKMCSLKMDCIKLKTIVEDLIETRHQFQTTFDGTIIQLHVNKKVIIELVNNFALAFAAGVETCKKIDLLKQKALKERIEQLKGIQNFNTAIGLKGLLTRFMGTRTKSIHSKLVACRHPVRLINNNLNIEYKEIVSKKESSDANLSTDKLNENRLEFQSSFMYSSAIGEDIEDLNRISLSLHTNSVLSPACDQTSNGSQSKSSNKQNKIIHNAENNHLSHRLEELESLLSKYYDYVRQIYDSMEFKAEIQDKTNELVEPVNAFNNIDAFFKAIERRLNHILYHTYCSQVTNEERNSEESTLDEHPC